MSKTAETLNNQQWNPDRACEEMAELFRKADEILAKPIYQDQPKQESQPDDERTIGLHQTGT